MYQAKDLDHVGGELGGAQDADAKQGHISLLSGKFSSMTIQTDSQFEVPGTWTSLGGSETASDYLKSREHSGNALLSTNCNKEEEEKAEEICSKHLHNHRDEQEIFMDCVYDVCHGGGEEDALSAAAFLSA
mmetsp:Transcript_30958/g.38009  ORF Transcript_30958/g.38009 Transcript_30958/m.38009 type:complete len:131 (+) Transcript_30958:458-850(+)